MPIQTEGMKECLSQQSSAERVGIECANEIEECKSMLRSTYPSGVGLQAGLSSGPLLCD